MYPLCNLFCLGISYFCSVNIDQKYMLRAIVLGKKALGSAAPNPMVGCVIVHNENIIGEGFTSAYGGAHAEVNAINSVADKSLLEKATLYVTLEPCSHHGKTPPCADLIVQHKIPKVVIGLKDPNPKVAGSGIHKIQQMGAEVQVGVLAEACREHHKRFLTFQEKKRPYIILKWAQTQDGFIAPDKTSRKENPEPYWITNAYSRQLVHRWRSDEMAILIGTSTALEDNPKLDVRNWAGRAPIRVLLDRSLKVPDAYTIKNGQVKTLLLTEKEGTNRQNLWYEQVVFDDNLGRTICNTLYKKNILSVIVEGGAKTLQTFIDSRLWDEARIFKNETCFHSGIPAPKINGGSSKQLYIGNDELILLRHD